jgi:hypothetical protein
VEAVACRVKVRLKVGGRVFEGAAILNSGFETDSPDIAIPVHVARELGLWPPTTRTLAALETGGGDVLLPYYESCATLELVLPDREPKAVRVNVIVDPHIDEVAISDYVASELGVMLIDFKKGLWRLADDPPETVRRSE